MFLDVDNLEHFFENVDVYDSAKKEIGNVVKKPADYKIDIGLDYKASLLRKAERLGFYEQLIKADANQRLPLEDNYFATVFSNIIYWLDNPGEALKEVGRILKPGGRCCIMVPNTSYLQASFYYNFCVRQKSKEFQFLEMIDRGRISENLKTVKSDKEWRRLIEEAGLTVEKCVPHLPKTVIQIWDIGLRPIFPLLKKMTMEISADKLLEIKNEWIDLFGKFLMPIVENEHLLTQGEEYTFYCYILKKAE